VLERVVLVVLVGALAAMAGCSLGGGDEPSKSRAVTTETTKTFQGDAAISTSRCIEHANGYDDCSFSIPGRKPIECRHIKHSEVREIEARLDSPHPEISVIC
jgi:hypothetical protein